MVEELHRQRQGSKTESETTQGSEELAGRTGRLWLRTVGRRLAGEARETVEGFSFK